MEGRPALRPQAEGGNQVAGERRRRWSSSSLAGKNKHTQRTKKAGKRAAKFLPNNMRAVLLNASACTRIISFLNDKKRQIVSKINQNVKLIQFYMKKKNPIV